MSAYKDLPKTWSARGEDADANMIMRGMLGVEEPFFVDVGAGDGIKISNTLALEKNGWNGILVEPNPELCDVAQVHRNAVLYRVAVSEKCGKVTLYVPNETITGITGGESLRGTLLLGELSPNDEFAAMTVRAHTLRCVLKLAEAPKNIHLLSMDIEGMEFLVLSRYFSDVAKEEEEKKPRIWMIVVETNRHQGCARSIDMFELLKRNGFRHLCCNGENEYYVHESVSLPVVDKYLLV